LYGGVTPRAVLHQALFLSNYYQIFEFNAHAAHGTGVLWSLAVEQHFYLFFPALFILLQRTLRTAVARASALAALCAATLAWRIIAFGNFESLFGEADPLIAANYCYMATECRLDATLFGCILGIVGNPHLDRSRFGDLFWTWVATPLSLLVVLATFLVNDEAFRQTWRYTIQSLALMPVFVAAVRCARHPLFRWLSFGPLRFIGVLSYPLYLVHEIVVCNFVLWFPHTTRLQQLVNGSAALAVSFALALAIYWGLEKRLPALRRKLQAPAQPVLQGVLRARTSWAP
jgi:peptidoglycan/LPS O-acetylase OafA/YrhL